MASAVDCMACSDGAQIEIIDELVKDAVARGAKVVVGGSRNTDLAPGVFYRPTVLIDVTTDMRIVNEEV